VRAGDFRAAEALFAEAATLAPGDPRPAVRHAFAVFCQGRIDDAFPLVEAALAKGDDAEGRMIAGRILAIRRHLERAAASFERATALEPERSDGWSALAAANLALGDEAAAARAYAESARLDPAKAEDRLWTDILRIQPDPVQIQEALDRSARGTAAYMASKYGEAAHELQAVIGTVPGFAHARAELGKAAWRMRNVALAERHLREAISSYRRDQEPLRADTQGVLAALLVSEKRNAREAVELARAALALRGERPMLLETLATACEQADDPACARETREHLVAARSKPGGLPVERDAPPRAATR
jgi:tetratricopeptide (TPR) repeat protein